MALIKNNITVILAFILPILLVIGIALSAYWPSFLSTDYDFVYATCDDGPRTYPDNCDTYLDSLYRVENGKLIAGIINPTDKHPIPHLFLHDTKNNESREVYLAEATGFHLSELLTSPDGVSVENAYDRSADFFPFFGGSSQYGYYLTKGSKRQKLNLVGENERNYYYRDNFKFIGWVEQN